LGGADDSGWVTGMDAGIAAAPCAALLAAVRAAVEAAPAPDAEVDEVPVVEELTELGAELQAARARMPAARTAPCIILGLT